MEEYGGPLPEMQSPDLEPLPQSRRMKIPKDMYSRCGILECKGCKALRAGMPQKPHLKECIKQVEEKMATKPEWAGKLEKSAIRVNTQENAHLARVLEAEDVGVLRRVLEDPPRRGNAEPTFIEVRWNGAEI